MPDWRFIVTAPRDGRYMKLLIPYDRSIFSEDECTTRGYWDVVTKCFRHEGDDGSHDIQPTHWAPEG